MPHIHPTAVVDRNAKIADDVTVGPFSVIGPRVQIGSGTSIASHCVIEGRTTLGRFNRVFHHCFLGGEPQDLKFRGEDATLEIGDYNDIRENVTMHIGTANGLGKTVVGSHNLIMVAAHIAHDCVVGDHCILSNAVLLAGHIEINDHAILAGAAAVSHYVTIGRYAYVGGLSGVVHDVPPFMISDGHPARVRAINAIGLGRHQFEPETIENLRKACQLLYTRKTEGSFLAALEEVDATMGHDAAVAELVTFARRMSDAPNGRYAEIARRDDKRRTPTR
jgi:UDP-N-acetylglucosamine acyltransferase